MDDILLNGRYRLERVLGEGGMSTVYLAHDEELKRQVAVKVLRPEMKRARDAAFLERFRKEAQAAAGLTHPNVVAVYDIGHDEKRDWHYVVMEYVEGSDLHRWLYNDEPLSPVQSLDIAIQIATALVYAHRAGRVHGDLKPGNILITQEMRVKVTDFGIAQALSSPPPAPPGAPAAKSIWGTPTYFAPEQAAGEPLAPSVDLYALGVIMYEMLSGRPPFVAADPFDLAIMHLEKLPPPLEQLNPYTPPKLAEIVHKLLSKTPAERYATAKQLSQTLIRYRQESEGTTGFHSPPDAGRWTMIAPKGLLAAILSLMALILVLGLVPLWSAVIRSRTDGKAAPPSALSSPTPAPAPGEIPVPSLVGLDRETARQALQKAGLGMSVAGQEYDEQAPALIVLRQSVPPGYPLPPESIVEVVISRGPNLVTVPSVVGLPLSKAEKSLWAAGLLSETSESWSEQPAGQVLSQAPPADLVVPANSTVALTISGGPRLPVGARLGEDIMLVACDLPHDTFRPGETLRVVLHWRALAHINEDYTVFVHLTGIEGKIVAQQDNRPVSGTQPTNSWKVGVPVADAYGLKIPPDTLPGDYLIQIGMYAGDTGRRLPIAEPGRLTELDGSLVLSRIQVK